MSAARTSEVIVIGAGIGGLAAAALLARAGRKVTVLEARNAPGGLCATAPLGEGFQAPSGAHTLYALDPELVKTLKLARRGLRFAIRDMALVGLRPEGRHVVLTRDIHATARALALQSGRDAEAWPRLRREFERLARRLRPLWWQSEGAVARARAGGALDALRNMGAAAWLDARFESEALKATLGADALSGGLSPLEPGSALTLLWRQSQEMCGLQGAVAMPVGGPGALAAALAEAARLAGADIRTGARVAAILADVGAVTGVALTSGEIIAGSHVLSGLSRRHTLCDLLPAAEAGFAAAAACERARPRIGTAQVVMALDRLPAFGGIATPAGARFVLADSLETCAAAHAAAQLGRLPDDPPIEFTLPTVADPSLAPLGQHVLSALIRPVPMAPSAGWAALAPQLLARVQAALARHAPDLARHVTQAQVLTPEEFHTQYGHEDASSSVMHILADWQTRIRTPLKGLLLCGAAAEPVPSISGRAGRIAAQQVLRETRQ